MLVAEVCTPQGVLCNFNTRKKKRKRTQRTQTSESCFSALGKLEAVFGKGRLQKFSKGALEEDVLQALANDARVKKLLTPQKTDNEFNFHHVNVGKVNSHVAREVLSDRLVDVMALISWYSWSHVALVHVDCTQTEP